MSLVTQVWMFFWTVFSSYSLLLVEMIRTVANYNQSRKLHLLPVSVSVDDVPVFVPDAERGLSFRVVEHRRPVEEFS
jgi:hypothetical protein